MYLNEPVYIAPFAVVHEIVPASFSVEFILFRNFATASSPVSANKGNTDTNIIRMMNNALFFIFYHVNKYFV